MQVRQALCIIKTWGALNRDEHSYNLFRTYHVIHPGTISTEEVILTFGKGFYGKYILDMVWKKLSEFNRKCYLCDNPSDTISHVLNAYMHFWDAHSNCHNILWYNSCLFQNQHNQYFIIDRRSPVHFVHHTCCYIFNNWQVGKNKYHNSQLCKLI